MNTPPITLVTAAAGKTRRRTARALLSRGLPVRAMVHREDARSAALRTSQDGASIGTLSVDSDLWQNTHDPDRIRDAQLPRIGVSWAVAR